MIVSNLRTLKDLGYSCGQTPSSLEEFLTMSCVEPVSVPPTCLLRPREDDSALTPGGAQHAPAVNKETQK